MKWNACDDFWIDTYTLVKDKMNIFENNMIIYIEKK